MDPLLLEQINLNPMIMRATIAASPEMLPSRTNRMKNPGIS